MRHPLIAGLALGLVAAPAAAQHAPWDREPGWEHDSGYADQRLGARRSGEREGKVVVSTFRAENAQGLGQGAIVTAQSPEWSGAPGRESTNYEAAVLDALGRHGYAISGGSSSADQQVELRVTRDIAVPEEAPRRPLSGSMSVGTGTYGSGVGLGLHLDLTKPKKAMIATRLEARIRSKASGAVLWEGRADIRTREDSKRWDDSAIAAALSDALFARFPETSG